ncbi:Flp pilus assembly protein TadG [Roseovarius sp. MBR-78]|uniref:TadE/TadG family type IV pilus assembly protein n=1 Tax=Roseovarius sp. MBR-78 TaxID=3156460 RepID=UPI0033916E8B
MGKRIARPLRAPDEDTARLFLRDERGSVTAFAFFIFLMMLLVGGLAVDTMRHEMVRARMQATLDRAVLAGAKSSDAKEARATIEDYFAKADLTQYLEAEQDGDIAIHLNSARVAARASGTIDTYLMKLAGVKTLSAGGSSAAEVRVPKLEISLVVDVSGSMAGTRMSRMKVAAKQFVSTIFNTSEPGNSVISFVPFSWTVTPPQTVFDTLAVNVTHNYSTCLRMNAADYQHATLTSGASALSNGVPVDQMIYTSLYGGFDNLQATSRSCYTDEYMFFLPYSTSEAALHAKIDSLQPAGNTSGHEGMNWGAALLDPSFRQISAALIANGEVDASLANIPANYDEGETLKVIVMMSDGANTESYFFDKSSPKYRGPNSDLFEVKFQDRVFKYAYHIYQHRIRYDESRCGRRNWECVYEANGPEKSVYYLRYPWGGWYWSIDDGRWITDHDFDNLDDTLGGYISTEQLSWEMAWGRMSPSYYNDITGDSRPWNDYVGSEQVGSLEKDARMRDVCGATKGKGVVVYAIGFEVPQGGRAEDVLSDCASSTSHYYRANTTDISAVFNSIAANVQNLRLTQ